MSKKKKKKEPSAASSAAKEAVVEREEQDDESGSTEAGSDEREEAVADVHAADAGHGGGHGGHDPVEDDRPRNGVIAFITLLTCIILVVFVIFVRELFNSWSDAELQSKVLGVQSEQLKELRQTEKSKLTKYQWVSQKDGVVRIPADRAVELTVASYRNPPPAKIETPPPAPAPEQVKPEEKPEEKKGDEGKDDKGKKDETTENKDKPKEGQK